MQWRPKDSLAREFDEWLSVIPGDVDATSEMVRQRIGSVSRQFARVLADVADDHQMSTGDWEALAVLARSSGEATLARTSTESNLMRECFADRELDQLNELLGTLLIRLESTYGPAPRHDMTRGRSWKE